MEPPLASVKVYALVRIGDYELRHLYLKFIRIHNLLSTRPWSMAIDPKVAQANLESKSAEEEQQSTPVDPIDPVCFFLINSKYMI